MSALRTLSELSGKGVHLRIEGSGLALSAPKGILTEGLVSKLRKQKPALLRSLLDIRDKAGDDWQEIVKHPDQVRDLIHSITTVEVRARGDIPPHYTATVYCQTCNQSVPHFPVGVTEVACCVWCLNGQPVLVAGNTQ